MYNTAMVDMTTGSTGEGLCYRTGIDENDAICAMILWIFGSPMEHRRNIRICPTVEDSLDYIIGRSDLHTYPTDEDSAVHYCGGESGFKGVIDESLFYEDIDEIIRKTKQKAENPKQEAKQMSLFDEVVA